jgi:hypothetical protein
MLLGIGSLIGFQGALGWMMVKSGMDVRPELACFLLAGVGCRNYVGTSDKGSWPSSLLDCSMIQKASMSLV